jgi:hypothetical protein
MRRPTSVVELRERTQALLDDCQRAVPSDTDIRSVIDALIGETTRLTECVLEFMPPDSAALAEALATAHTTLVRLVETVERREASVRAGASAQATRDSRPPER